MLTTEDAEDAERNGVFKNLEAAVLRSEGSVL